MSEEVTEFRSFGVSEFSELESFRVRELANGIFLVRLFFGEVRTACVSGRSSRSADQVGTTGQTRKTPSCLRGSGRRPGWWEAGRVLISIALRIPHSAIPLVPERDEFNSPG
jgi:hypothetical protein